MKKIFTILFLAFGPLANAQTVCDSLEIKVQYYPFTDTLLQINVTNNGQAYFGYPMFTMFDSNGDTVAKESMNLFGIGQYSQHVLDAYPGMPASNVFSGSLQLYYATVDSYAVCTYNMNFNLCPDTTCRMFYPYLTNYGGMEVIGDAAWEMLDADSISVGSGTFTLDTNEQYSVDSICLGPGNYFLKVTDVSLNPGGQKVTGVMNYMLPAPNPEASFNDTLVYIPFSLYEACFTSVSVKTNIPKSLSPDIYSFEDNIYINGRSGDPLGNVSVYSMDGQKVFSRNIQHTKYTVNLSSFSTGMYIVRVNNRSGTMIKKVFIE